MVPERAADRELIDGAADRQRRRQEQRIDETAAAGELPEGDHQKERGPAGITAGLRDKARATERDGPRLALRIGLDIDLGPRRLVRAVKHPEPRARRRSLPRGAATTVYFAATATGRAH